MTRRTYKAKPGLLVHVQRRKVTDDVRGVSLAVTAEVLEHVALQRLVEISTKASKNTARSAPAPAKES